MTMWTTHHKTTAALAKLGQVMSDRGNESLFVSTGEGGPKSSGMPFAALVGKQQQLFAAVDGLVEKLREALTTRKG